MQDRDALRERNAKELQVAWQKFLKWQKAKEDMRKNMKQYCRYCGWLRDLGDGGPWYCEAKEKEIRRIKSPNKCKDYGYCGLNEFQIEHKPREYRRKNKVDSISISLF